MEDTWLFLIGLGKLSINFPRQPRSHHIFMQTLTNFLKNKLVKEYKLSKNSVLQCTSKFL